MPEIILICLPCLQSHQLPLNPHSCSDCAKVCVRNASKTCGARPVASCHNMCHGRSCLRARMKPLRPPCDWALANSVRFTASRLRGWPCGLAAMGCPPVQAGGRAHVVKAVLKNQCHQAASNIKIHSHTQPMHADSFSHRGYLSCACRN